MELTVKRVDMETKSPTVLVNKQDAEELGVNALDRVQIKSREAEVTTGIVDITEEMVGSGSLGATARLNHLSDTVEVSLAPRPRSVEYIRRKLDDGELSKEQIHAIITDINNNRLNDIELSSYVSAIYSNGLSMDETIHLTESMVAVGDHLKWEEPLLADKHSIGGVAGNRVTPIIVPIVAAAGIKMPKTSSRAITSPAGTADTVEVLCDVDFSLDEIRDIVEETNGCMVWGGSVNLSPADEKIIRAEHPLSIDPDGQVLASVLSKKKSAGSTHIVIDIPYGEGSKVENLGKAREMAHDFKKVGTHLDMHIACTITKGSEPIGRGVGPVLEARDILNVLNGEGPDDLKMKSIRLADTLFELCGMDKRAEVILQSGRAMDKFRDIIEAQHGDPDVSLEDLPPGKHQETVCAERDGVVTHIDNRAISEAARRAGAPKDQAAGAYMHVRVGDSVVTGEELFTLYAESADKLTEAEQVSTDHETVRVRRNCETLIETT